MLSTKQNTLEVQPGFRAAIPLWPLPFQHTVLLLLSIQNSVAAIILRALHTYGAPVHWEMHLLLQELLKISVSIVLLRGQFGTSRAVRRQVLAGFTNAKMFIGLLGMFHSMHLWQFKLSNFGCPCSALNAVHSC